MKTILSIFMLSLYLNLSAADPIVKQRVSFDGGKTWSVIRDNETRKSMALALSESNGTAGYAKKSVTQASPAASVDFYCHNTLSGLEVRFTGKHEAVTISLFDLSGRPLASVSSFTGSEHVFGKSGIAPGAYFVTVNTGSSVITRKVIIL